jgi:hypothetical protein
MDSLGSDQLEDDVITVWRWLNDELRFHWGHKEPLNQSDWTFGCFRDEVPRQTNGWDCGLYAVTFGICIGLQASFEGITPAHILAFRQKLILFMLDGDPDGDILLTQPWFMDFLSTSSLFPLEEIRLTGAHIPPGLVDVEGDGNCLFYCFLIYLVRTKNVSMTWDEEDPPLVWMRKCIRDGVDSLDEQDWLTLKFQWGEDLIESEKDRIFFPEVDYYDGLMMTST